LDEERLRKLVHIVLERLPTDQSPAERLEFKVFRGDAYSYTTSSVEDVLKEDNADWRKITRLDLRSASEKPVMFSLRFDKAGTSLEIDGDDRDVVFVLFSDVREYLREEVNRAVSIPRNATRLLFMLVTILAMVWLLWWMYSRLGTFTDTAAAIAALRTVDVAAKLDYLILRTVREAGMRPPIAPLALMLFGMLAGVGDLPGAIVRTLFPANVFLFGAQRLRYERRRRLLTNVLWVVLIGGAVSFLVGILVWKLTGTH